MMAINTPQDNSNDDGYNPILQMIINLKDQMNDESNTTSSDNNPPSSLLQKTIQSLNTTFKPHDIMDTIAPHLFHTPTSSPPSPITNNEALSLITLLVSSHPTLYLKASSRSVSQYITTQLTSLKEPPSLIISDELLSTLISHQLTSSDVEVSSLTSQTLVTLCRYLSPPVTSRTLSRLCRTWMTTMAPKGDYRTQSTLWVRLASTVMEIAALSDRAMTIIDDLGLWKLFLDLLSDDKDPLLRLSLLDVLSETILATERRQQPLGYAARRVQCVVNSRELWGLLVRLAQEDDMGSGGVALRLLSSLCRILGGGYVADDDDPSSSSSSSRYYDDDEFVAHFRRVLHQFNRLSGETNRLAFIDAVSSFAGASRSFLVMVLNDEELREGWLSLSVAQPKLKAVVLMSVANVMDPIVVRDEMTGDELKRFVPEENDVRQLWTVWGRVNGREIHEAVALLLSLARQVVVEVRLGAYRFIHAMVKRLPRLLLLHEGFFEFVIDIQKETTKEGREAKFEIVQALYDSDVKGLLANDVVRTMERVLKEGPHYKKVIPWQMMTE